LAPGVQRVPPAQLTRRADSKPGDGPRGLGPQGSKEGRKLTFWLAPDSGAGQQARSLTQRLVPAPWACQHVRRKFVEAEPHYPEAGAMIDRIGQLYAIEAEAKQASPEERLATLAALRADQSKPVLDEIRTWLMTQRALPRSALGKASPTRAACGRDSSASSRTRRSRWTRTPSSGRYAASLSGGRTTTGAGRSEGLGWRRSSTH
jgi:hypothetical protein